MVTCSNFAFGDQMGAQMMKLAHCLLIAQENNQSVCLFDELKYYGRGYKVFDVFNLPEIETISRSEKGIKLCIKNKANNIFTKIPRFGKRVGIIRKCFDKAFYLYVTKIVYRDFIRIADLIDDVDVHSSLIGNALDLKNNYDIITGYGTAKSWDDDFIKYLNNCITFKDAVRKEGIAEWNRITKAVPANSQTVSIHIRRTDYLSSPVHIKLGNEYYEKAMSMFDNAIFIVFSDDIEWCKESELFKRDNIMFIDTSSAEIDMFLMSKCNNNIIANSTYSFWAAFLNKHKNKKVVCPRNFVTENNKYSYLNGNWYIYNWIAIE